MSMYIYILGSMGYLDQLQSIACLQIASLNLVGSLIE